MWTNIGTDIFGLNKISSFECEEIIPLTLCSDCEILRAQYPNVHSSVAGYSIPDDEWHAVYLEVCLEFRGQEVRHKLLYLHMENLLCFEQVFQAHQIPIDVLYAKRVEGKSGSWEFIHSEESQIMQSIGQAPVDIASQDLGGGLSRIYQRRRTYIWICQLVSAALEYGHHRRFRLVLDKWIAREWFEHGFTIHLIQELRNHVVCSYGCGCTGKRSRSE